MSAPPRVIVLWLPDWPIEALRREEPGLGADAPLAIIADGAVAAVSAAGRRSGVRRGLRRREAQSCCPDIVLRAADPDRDARAFEPLVTALEAIVPGVAVARPGLCAIRAAGPAVYYGAERAAAEALLGRLAGLGAVAVAGLADGVFAAERAARAALQAGGGVQPDGARVVRIPPGRSAEFLAPMPVSVLLDAEALDDALPGLLERLGIHTLGAFAALPADAVLDRFGPEGLALHRRAAGADERAAEPRTPPPELIARAAFEPPLERAEQVAFAMRAEAERFVEELTGRRLACTGLRVSAVDAEGGESERVWLHPGAFSPADVVDRIRWQLGGAIAETGPAAGRLRAGVAELRIAPESVDPIGAHEPGLWGDAGADDRVHRALARLQSLLGHGAVLRPAVSGGRDPRDRQRAIPWGDRGPAGATAGPWPGRLPSPSPGSVFADPHPVLVVDRAGAEVSVSDRGAVSGEPARLALADRSLELTAWAGPWPLLRHDARQARWRFQAVDEGGCGWLLSRDGEGWWAEARYD